MAAKTMFKTVYAIDVAQHRLGESRECRPGQDTLLADQH